jgi:hypothetical protein
MPAKDERRRRSRDAEAREVCDELRGLMAGLEASVAALRAEIVPPAGDSGVADGKEAIPS